MVFVADPKTYESFLMPSTQSAPQDNSVAPLTVPASISQRSTPAPALAKGKQPSTSTSSGRKRDRKGKRKAQSGGSGSDSGGEEADYDALDARPKKKATLKQLDNFLADDGTEKISSNPEKRKWYDNGVAVTRAQHQAVESLGSEYEKEKAYNQLRNQTFLRELNIAGDVSSMFNQRCVC